MPSLVYIKPEHLEIGMFVNLKLSWLRHPFAFNSFVIQTEEQLATIRGLNLKEVEVDPLRNQIIVTNRPESKAGQRDEGKPPASSDAVRADLVIVEKQRRIEKNKALRSNIADAERHAVKAAQTVRQATKQFNARPAETIAAAESLIADIAQSLLGNSDVMVHLLSDKVAGEEVYYHSLNVTMLALLLGKALQMDADMLQTIGMAAIFHDIGKQDMPTQILLKTDPLTHAEVELVKQHALIGAQTALRGKMPTPVVAAIVQHHENVDGSGYPNGLKADQITPAAKVIAIVNHYDNLCNPISIAKALTPYEALSTMFAKRKGWFDQAMLGKLVQILGVYPPGSIVQLSNGTTAMVVSVNSAHPLQPSVLIYDPSVPKAESIIFDLETDKEISISKAIRPATLTPAVIEYLSPRKRVTYYFGDETTPA